VSHGDYSQALDEMSKVKRLKAKERRGPQTNALLAAINLGLGRTVEAQLQLEAAWKLAIAPISHPALHLLEAQLQLSQGHFRAALRCCSSAADAFKNQGLDTPAEIELQLALSLQQQGNLKEACDHAILARTRYLERVKYGGVEPPQVQQLIEMCCGELPA
jgi:hypothetical protein